MKSAIRTFALSLALGLCGCFAQLEDSSVGITQSLCSPSTSDCIPGAGQPLTFIQVSGKNTYAIPLGDQDLFKPETTLGPTKLVSTLIINSVKLHMRTAGGDFNGITQLSFLAAPRESTGPSDDPCASPTTPCPVLASYTQAGPPASPLQDLVLTGAGQNVIAQIDQVKHQLVIEIKASGKSPTPVLWNADLTVDMALKARANFP